jgi:hypothetical protein
LSDRPHTHIGLIVGGAVGAVGAVASWPAAAHGAFGSAAPFWSGALHVGVSPLAIAAIVGFGAAVARALNDPVLNAVAIASVVAGLGAWWLPSAFGQFASLAVVIVGLVAALGREPNHWMSLGLGACAGLAVGGSVELDTRGWAQGLGVAAATLLALIWAVEIVSFVRARLPLAGRVVGAWVAAIALLLVALAVRNSSLISHSGT